MRKDDKILEIFEQKNHFGTFSTVSLADESYTYDAVGNRLTAVDVNGTWNYNAKNELLGFADEACTYDTNGNMTQIKVAGGGCVDIHV